MGTTIVTPQNKQNTYQAQSIPQGPAAGNLAWNAYLASQGQAAQGAAQDAAKSGLQQELLAYANQQTQTGYQNEALQNSLARLGLSGQQQQIQQGALTRAEKLLPQTHGLTLADLAQQRAQAWQGAQQQQRALSSSAIAGGSLQSIGTNQGMQDIKTQLGESLASIGRNVTRENLSYQQQQAAFKDQQKNLDIASKGLGIDKTELWQKTQQALDQLGLSTTLTVQQIMQGVAQAQLGQASPLGSAIPYIMQAAGFNVGGGAQGPAG